MSLCRPGRARPTLHPCAIPPTHQNKIDYIGRAKSIFQLFDGHYKQLLITELLGCCDNQLLSQIHTLIAPKLKVDFLRQLPSEIAFQILSFIDPPTLAQCDKVSGYWHSLLQDDTTWKSLCLKYHYCHRFPVLQSMSFKNHFIRRYTIEHAWTQDTGTIAYCPNDIGSGLVTSLQMDDKFIVVGCDNRRIEVYDSTNGKFIRTLRGHEGGVWALQFIQLENGKHRLISGGCDRQVRVWDLPNGCPLHVLRGHTSTIRCLKVRDSKIAVTGSRDTTLRIWDIEHGTLKHVCTGHQASVRCLEIHGNLVASGSYDSTARLWDIETGECLFVLAGHHSQIYAIAFDGSRIVTGSLDSNIRIWCAQTGKCIAFLQGHTSLVGHLQLIKPVSSSDLSLLVSGASDGCLRVWNLETNECIHRISAHDNSITCLQVEGKRILSGGSDGQIKLWDIDTGHLLRPFTMPGKSVWRLQFNDTKAVVILQRRSQPDTETLHTAIELHDFDNYSKP
ncbi:quinon protein alcohol dehydrogenase-like superfamily [Phycomyces nitens]|nr:quinon protein alcohol dehydrogenase-like superfamily [Phycomyces nitens]